ncbi:MAG: FAD-dependent oxidoreductase [Armatimonadetes bacterium]|nr:FAD-dependent oxidoreductase [Armatimonadota bacterium]
MAHYRYLIIGGGMTGDAAIRGIRDVDATAPVGLIGAESQPPYNRPPLTKGLWKGQAEEEIWRQTDSLGAELHLGRRAVQLDPKNRRVTDDRGGAYTYEKLLLATGGTPRRLPADPQGISYYRTYRDYRDLRERTEEGERFAVIGGGFIGSEVAAALAMNGKRVTMILRGDGVGDHLFPPDLVKFLNGYYADKGVEILTVDEVAVVSRTGVKQGITTKHGRTLEVDGIIAGIGIAPNTQLAEAAGLKVENGIIVDEFLRTSQPEIHAAGDVANFYNPSLGARLRVEHEDNANDMGRAAGKNMAGEPEPYHHLPFFYSDLFDLGYEAVGDVNSKLSMVEDWKEPYREGVVYYLKDGRVKGVLLWNVWEQVDNARKLIAERGPLKPDNLKGRLPA